MYENNMEGFKISKMKKNVRKFSGMGMSIILHDETHTIGLGKIRLYEKPVASFNLENLLESLTKIKKLYGELDEGEILRLFIWENDKDQIGSSMAVILQDFNNEMITDIGAVIIGCDERPIASLPIYKNKKNIENEDPIAKAIIEYINIVVKFEGSAKELRQELLDYIKIDINITSKLLGNRISKILWPYLQKEVNAKREKNKTYYIYTFTKKGV